MSIEESFINSISFSLPHFTTTQKGWKFNALTVSMDSETTKVGTTVLVE
jgi:hypothetical protein